MNIAFDLPEEVRPTRAASPFAKVVRSPLPNFIEEPPAVDLKKLEAELSRNRLDEIAAVMRSLTYGEMMDLAKVIWEKRPMDVLPLTEETLPGVLYRFATGAAEVSQK